MYKTCLALIAVSLTVTGCTTSKNAEVATSTIPPTANPQSVDLSSLFGDPVSFALENYDLESTRGGTELDPSQQYSDQQMHNEIQRIILNGGIVGGPNGQLTPSGSIPAQLAPLPTQPAPIPNTIFVPPQSNGTQPVSPEIEESEVSPVDCSLEIVQGVTENGSGYLYIVSAVGPSLSTLFIKVKWLNKTEYSTLTLNQKGEGGTVLLTSSPRPPIIVAYSDPALSADSLSCSSV